MAPPRSPILRLRAQANEALDEAKRLCGEATAGALRYKHVVIFDVGALRLAMLGPRARRVLQAIIGLGSEYVDRNPLLARILKNLRISLSGTTPRASTACSS